MSFGYRGRRKPPPSELAGLLGETLLDHYVLALNEISAERDSSNIGESSSARTCELRPCNSRPGNESTTERLLRPKRTTTVTLACLRYELQCRYATPNVSKP